MDKDYSPVAVVVSEGEENVMTDVERMQLAVVEENIDAVRKMIKDAIDNGHGIIEYGGIKSKNHKLFSIIYNNPEMKRRVEAMGVRVVWAHTKWGVMYRDTLLLTDDAFLEYYDCYWPHVTLAVVAAILALIGVAVLAIHALAG